MSREKKKSNVIEIKDVSFRYGTVVVLDTINVRINAGDYWGIIGPNGAGKTTLLKIMVGLLNPTSGSIRVMGQSISKRLARRIIGYVPQNSSQEFLHFPVSVQEVVMTGLTQRVGLLRTIERESKKELHQLLDLLDLYDHRYMPLRSLSGGQRQKVFLARALIAHPEVLVLDEPSIGVDVAVQEAFYALIKKLHVKYNLTIVLVSHDLNVITQEVEQVLCLNKNMVCRVPIKDFMSGNYIDKLYGENVKLIRHHH